MKRTPFKSKLDVDETLVITVGEARKLLGSDGNNLDDEELAIQIALVQELAIEIIKYKYFAK